MQVIFEAMKNLIKAHYRGMTSQLDPVLESSKKPSRVHFAFALFVSGFVSIFGIFGLDPNFWSSPWATLNPKSLARSPYPFTHQMAPPTIWTILDIGFLIDCLATIPLYAVLTFQPDLDARFVMRKIGKLIYIGTGALSKTDSEKIRAIRNRIKKPVYNLITVQYILCIAFFNSQVYFNGSYAHTVTTYVYWLFMFPLFIAYILYGELWGRSHTT